MAKSVQNSVKTATQGLCSSLSEFGVMIRDIRHGRSMTMDQLAVTTGISKPYLSNIETARLSGPPSPEILARLESGLGVKNGSLIQMADWLRTPDSIRRLMPESRKAAFENKNLKATASLASVKNVGQTHSPPGFVSLNQIPLLNRVAAGKPAEIPNLDYPTGITDSYISAPAPDSPGQSAQDLFALRIQDDSMEPDYRTGDILVFSTTHSPMSGQDCLVRLDEAENFATAFKRIYFVDASGKPDETAGLVQLVPLNPKHKTRSVQRSRILGLFPAVWKITPAGSASAPSAEKSRKIKRTKSRPKISAATLRPASSGFSIEND